ncbi:MAG: cytochrome c [Chloroflexota bacterium]
MQSKVLIISFLAIWLLVGCGSAPDTETPELNLSNVQTILPTVDPSAAANYAQIADEDTLALGQSVYEANCASCHGINGEGQFPDAPMQPDDTGRIGAPPHNSNGHTWHHDDDLLYDIVRNGGKGTPDRFYPMPAFGEQLSDDEIIAVIEYIKTMWSEEERFIQAERTLTVREQNQ